MNEEEILAVLHSLEDNPAYVTKSAYRANAQLWPGNRISFTDTHMAYLKAHPILDPKHYLSNLKLMLHKTPKMHVD